MIITTGDNILVKPINKDTRVGSLTICQDQDSSYLYCEIVSISDESLKILNTTKEFLKDKYLVVSRIAKIPFIKDQVFISSKDVRAIMDKEYFDNI